MRGPAVCPVAEPVLPVAVPGAAVSPGKRICSLVTEPAFSVNDGLVLAVLLPSVVSVAVSVRLPAVLSVTLKVFVPATSAALAGIVALASLEVIATVSLVLTTFQFASTALTVMVNAVPAVCAVGVPVLPVGVPGAAISPGTNTCNFVNPPALTGIEGLMFAVLVPSLTSVAVTVKLPVVLSVTLKTPLPEARAELPGRPALASLEVMPTV